MCSTKSRLFVLLFFSLVLSILVFAVMKRNMAELTAAISNQPITFIIDAGHGGEDGGAVGVEGTTESRINLSIALRLEQFLEFCGYQTQMIRTTDVSVYTQGDTIAERKVSDLKKRVELVNHVDPAILISIHQNHFSEEQYSGAQVFYSAVSGSKELAEEMQNTLRYTLDPNNRREIKRADSVYLLEKARCPAVLVECGFLSNSREEQLLLNSDYQKKIICAITCALTDHVSKGADELEV